MVARKSPLILMAAILAVPLCTWGQRGGAEPGVGGDAASFDSIKTSIRATDEEWKIIGAKLRKVMAARAVVEANAAADGTAVAGGGGGRGGRGNDSFGGPSDRADGGRGGPGGDRGAPGAGGPPGGGGRGGPEASGRGGPDGAGRGEPPPAGAAGAPAGPDAPGAGGPPGGGRGGPDFAGGPGGPGGPFGGGRGGGPGPGGGGGPRGGGGGAPVPSVAVNIALAALRSTLNDPNASNAELEKKTAAVLKARAWSKANLNGAENELRELLTEDQQAVLVSEGYID